MTTEVSLYDAKTHLSALIERAAGGEVIIITKKGTPKAKLSPIENSGRREFGKNVMGVPPGLDLSFLDPDPEITALFEGSEDDDDEWT